MSTKQDEGRERPRAPEAQTAGGLHEDSNGMRGVLWRSGWAQPVGEGLFTRVEVQDASVTWVRFASNDLRLGHIATMFLLQGSPLLPLFDASSRLVCAAGDFLGPFFVLRGSLCILEAKIEGLVLGRVLWQKEGLPPEELLATLYSGAQA